MPSRRRFSFPWSKSLLLSKFHFSMSSCHLVSFLFACLKSRSEIYVCHSLWHIAHHLIYSWNETYASASSASSQQGLHIKGCMHYHLSSKPKDIPSQFSSSFLPSRNPQKTSLSQNSFCHKKCNKPCDFIENTGNLANDLGVCQWCAICFENVRPNSEPLRTWWTRRAVFFFLPTMGSWVSKNPFSVVN